MELIEKVKDLFGINTNVVEESKPEPTGSMKTLYHKNMPPLSKRSDAAFSGWYFFRMSRYTWKNMKDLEEWCHTGFQRGDFRLIGFNQRCPYEVGILIQHPMDALFYKLTWQSDQHDELEFDGMGENPFLDEEEDE